MVAGRGRAGCGIGEVVGRWPRTLEMLESEVPVYIENTAGGENAVARGFDALALVWEAVAGAKTGVEVGVCFERCHTQPAGEELSGRSDRVRTSVAKIALRHANDSRAPPGTHAASHAGLAEI